MRRIRSKLESNTFVVTDIRCADCGLQAKEYLEYVEIKQLAEGQKEG